MCSSMLVTMSLCCATEVTAASLPSDVLQLFSSSYI